MASSKVALPKAIVDFLKAKGFHNVLEKVQIIAFGKGQCKAELLVDESHTNPMGGLHGGFSATLVDNISSYALASIENWSSPSISTDMHLTYIKGAKRGDKILIEAKTIKAGKSLAFLEVLITNKDTGDVLVKGCHTKYLHR